MFILDNYKETCPNHYKFIPGNLKKTYGQFLGSFPNFYRQENLTNIHQKFSQNLTNILSLN